MYLLVDSCSLCAARATGIFLFVSSGEVRCFLCPWTLNGR
nr:MAG TPA: hypothetical protein [Caudoviricetes sp.]